MRARGARPRHGKSMIILFGSIVVLLSVFGGFIIGGGNVGALLHVSELLIIAGGACGALVIMSFRARS